tara:strand:+ start:1978 stop:2976 length:999 start_codon:yes stop_codon:yes gene_type:complete
MIYKSYILEQNIKTAFDKKMFLFYGENQGLKNDLKNQIKENKKDSEIIRLYQEDLLKNEELFFNEINNKSLFNENKIILINEATDKIFPQIEKMENMISNEKVFIFSDILDKKSKLRNCFEKSNNLGVVACYEDNEVQMRKIISTKLREYQKLTPELINRLIQTSGLNRSKTNNEIEKIKSFFTNKIIDETKIDSLLNIRTNEDFNKLKDAALNGNKENTNKLLADTPFSLENNVLYLSLINQRIMLLEKINILKSDKKNIENIIQNLRPPIFWKDKPMIISQSTKWNSFKIKEAMRKTYDAELQLKSNSSINKEVIIKNLIVELCSTATAA